MKSLNLVLATALSAFMTVGVSADCGDEKAHAGKHRFKVLDVNADGRLAEQEFIDGHAGMKDGDHEGHHVFKERFAAIDTDGDGGISEEEFNAHHEHHGKGMHEKHHGKEMHEKHQSSKDDDSHDGGR